MPGRVYNAIGGTSADPCPTKGPPYCSLSDFRSWRHAAARLYEQGIAPAWATLASAAPSTEDADARAALQHRVEAYAAQFNALKRSGSFWSSADNLELSAQAIAIMQGGDALLDDLVAAIEATGATPPTIPIPTTPPTARPKSSLRRYALPAAFGVGIVAVIGLAAWAATNGSREGAANGNGRTRNRA